MSGRVEGKVAFITGAARGQGRSHAVRLAQEGADIIAIDICGPIDNVVYPASTPDDLAETADTGQGTRAAASSPPRSTCVTTRRSKPRWTTAWSNSADSTSSSPTRASAMAATSFTRSRESIWQDMIDVNLSGVWKTVKAGVPHLIAGGRGGSIVLTRSVGGMKALAHTGHYIAAKHGVIGLMRSFAVELGQHMIRVNSVHPTQVNTPMTMNDVTFPLVPARPQGKPRARRLRPVLPDDAHFAGAAGWNRLTSATRYCSSPLTNLVMSQAFRFPSTRAACSSRHH